MRGLLRSLPLVLVIAAQSLHAESYVNRRVKSEHKTIRSVVLLPPTATKPGPWPSRGEVVRAVMRGRRDLGRGQEEAEGLASEIAGIVANALRKKGWDVNDSVLSSQSLQNNEKLKNLVDYLCARYETLVTQMIRRPKDVSKGRYSLGDDVANLSAPPTDVLVLVYGSCEWAYKGSTAPPVWGAGGQTKDTFLHISLVDPHTGEVLCYFQVPGAVEERILRELRAASPRSERS
jgi:lambda repressor-like predicted transcriptional regulator